VQRFGYAGGCRRWAEDLGSKNGTLRGRPITRREKLADGDAIALGGVVFVFRTPSADRSTRTWKKPKRL
jgi:pSer/pThr/pTyr-binding forkhead associated (FHA) protein